MSELTPHQFKALKSEGHLALTANAGSGKTFVLARKYLSVLLRDDVEVTNVAAITFTEKAASELYFKIASLVDSTIQLANSDSERLKLEKIRRQLVSANISTIHSFCIDILKQFPVEAQLDARFVPIDEKLSDELIELSVEEMIKASFDDEKFGEDLKYLIRIFSSKTRLASELIKLISKRKNVLSVKNDIYSKDAKQIQRYFNEQFEKYFLLIWDKFKNEFISALDKINNRVLGNKSDNQSAIELKYLLNTLKDLKRAKDIIRILEGIQPLAFTKNNSIRVKGYLTNSIDEGLEEEILKAQIIISEFKNFEYPSDHNLLEKDLAHFGLLLINYFDKALSIYELKKKSEGFVDFEDILIHTKILLQNNDVQKSLSEKYKFIMVDEFQDTNEIQYQIFLPILDYLKNGKLFIVGDEKQSIYKFRDAEIEIFNLTKDNIKTEAGNESLLILPDSFRMSPALCAFTNYVFKNLFAYPTELFGEVPNTDIVCARNDNVKGKIEFLISRTGKDIEAVSESDLVADKILQIVNDKNYEFKDICILVRKRKNFDELEKSFLQKNIPYEIIGGRGFYQRQTISDIFNYLSFLADENNNTALVGILRSPFFSISDAKIFEISLQKENSFWRKLKSYSTEKNELKQCIEILQENIKLSNSIELPQLLKKIITDEDYLSIVSSRIYGTQEIANINKLINIARNFNSKGFRNLYDFINYLKDSITGLEDEAQATFETEKDSVQLMTIHQAKGLEFPIVFIYKSSEHGMSGLLKSGQIQVDKKFGVLSKLPFNGQYLEDYRSAPVINVYNYLEAKKNLAELKRLLYVAITRAKDQLYISAELQEGKSFNKESFITLLNQAVEIDFEGSSIFVNDDLEFLINANGNYLTRSEKIDLTIPIVTKIISNQISETIKPNIEQKPNFQLDKILSREKEEIISATKVSLFSQCPLKYFLTYEYGFGKLNSDLIQFKKSNFESLKKLSEQNETVLSDDPSEETDNEILFNRAEYGKLFHFLLEKEVPVSEIDNFLIQTKGSVTAAKTGQIVDTELLKNDLTKYYNSGVYKKIRSFKNYKNEFEIYIKEEDYFLHGIIDKIIFDEKKIIIIDYKTDSISEKEVESQAEHYSMQLKFYLYIASKQFNEFENFEGNLVFIKQPEKLVTISFDKGSIKNLQSEIKSVLDSLRKKEMNKNFNHCSSCVFSGFTKNCIIN